MIYGYWGYNINKNKYEPFSEEPLSLFPTVVEFKKRIVYCRQCHRWEYIIHFSNNVLTSQCGKKYAGPFVVENSLINFSYDISKIKDSYLIKVKSQTASINKRFIQDSEYFLDLEYKAGDSKMKSYNPDTGKEEIVDTPDEQRYCFYVARNSSTLREIGSAMHNCVGWGYASSVQERHCTIVYAKYQGAYRICIEVTPNFSIRQSLGPCNQPLGGKDLEAYHEWCTEKNIVFKKAFAVHTAR